MEFKWLQMSGFHAEIPHASNRRIKTGVILQMLTVNSLCHLSSHPACKNGKATHLFIIYRFCNDFSHNEQGFFVTVYMFIFWAFTLVSTSKITRRIKPEAQDLNLNRFCNNVSYTAEGNFASIC